MGAGTGFAVVCPPIAFGDELACNGPDVENVNGRCQPKVTGCVGPSVEVDASGNCVAKVDKFIETYLDKVAAKLQDDADAMSAEVKLFKQCAIKNALFVGTDAEGADSDGCGAVVADNEAVTNGLDEVSNKVKELVDKDVAKVRADTTKATAGIAALNKGILKCGEQNKLLLGDIDAADDDGCGEALLAVANQSASATVLDAYPESMDCADDYAMGEIIIVKIKEKTKLLMLCDGEKFVLFSHSGGNKEFAYSGKTQSYTVPFPVTEITIHAFGAGGGTGLAHNQAQRSRGGAGGYATATVAVKPGDKFSVIVGEGGRNGKIPPKANSFGGGGMGQWWSQGGYWGANGGGMSGVFKTEEDFSAKTWKHNAVAWNQAALRKGPSHFDWIEYQKTAVVVAAGGGGGGGGPWDSSPGAHGGHGGGAVGGRGLRGNNGYTTGGTQSAGGACYNGPGQPNEGGNQHQFNLVMWPFGWPMHGATDYPRLHGSFSRQYGGGGGGGYFGGGHGAYNNGGGGGSSFLHKDAKSSKTIAGSDEGCKSLAGGRQTDNYPGGNVGNGGPSAQNGCAAASGGHGFVLIEEAY